MVEKYPSKVLEPSQAEAAPKENRGRPFERGNPGRPRGSKNRMTRLLEELVAGEGEKLTQTDLYERDRLARIKLFAKFGVSREHKSEEIAEALERMEAGLPERYKAR